MRPRLVLSVLIPFAMLAAAGQPPQQQATIENSGSTNAPGVKLIIKPSGEAEVQSRNAEARKTTVDEQLSRRLFDDLNSIGPLSALPRTHCIKSVSFGTSLYIEYNGERSPDLSCPAAADSKLGMLQKDAHELMNAAHANQRVGPRTPIFTAPRN